MHARRFLFLALIAAGCASPLTVAEDRDASALLDGGLLFSPATPNESAGLAAPKCPEFPAGQCVANGGDIACRQCPPFLGDCKQGNVPADLDGDGCIDGCKTR